MGPANAAFLPPSPLVSRATQQSSRTSRHASPRRARQPMRAQVQTPPPTPTPPEEGQTPTEKAESASVSAWAVASFGIIFAIFAVAIVATLARDFVPGGMVAPAPGTL